MNQRIAFFDFDGTITTKDTLLEFIKYSKGKFRFYLGFALNIPWLIAYRLKIISNQAAKERILTFFFKNDRLEDFQQQCDRFATNEVPALVRPKALQEIAKLQQAGFAVTIVSASPENWIRKWTMERGLSLIATRLVTRDAPTRSATAPSGKGGMAVPSASGGKKLTGKIEGANCHGKEKVNRIHQACTLSDYHEIYAYGDTSGDRPMLALAHISFYKPFR